MLFYAIFVDKEFNYNLIFNTVVLKRTKQQMCHCSYKGKFSFSICYKTVYRPALTRTMQSSVPLVISSHMIHTWYNYLVKYFNELVFSSAVLQDSYIYCMEKKRKEGWKTESFTVYFWLNQIYYRKSKTSRESSLTQTRKSSMQEEQTCAHLSVRAQSEISTRQY